MVVAEFLMKHVKMEFVLITMSIIKIRNLQLIFTQIEKLRLKPPNEPLGLIVYQRNFRKQSFSRFSCTQHQLDYKYQSVKHLQYLDNAFVNI